MNNGMLKVLDCTLRDGGYYNEWDFSPELVKSYLRSIGEAGVDIIEIGFRLPPQNGFRGAFAYSSDDFLKGLSIPDKTVLAVMVNASDIITHPGGVQAALGKMFAPSEQSPVGLVRIATHLKDIPECRAVAEELKRLGYQVALNMMQVGGKSPDTISSYAHEVQSWGAVDVLYFADSLGNMDTKMVAGTIDAIKSEWSGDIGIHAHDNMGRAVTNTLSAIGSGATWLDGTVLGMGRGAGNAQSEHLLIELNKRGLDGYHPDALFQLVLNEFDKLHKKYRWGPGLLYYISGAYNIHPTYVQEIIRTDDNNPEHVIDTIQALRKGNSNSYSVELLQASMSQRRSDICFPGTWSATEWAKGRAVLLVGQGPWVHENMDSMLYFIDKADPVVICLNTNIPLPHDRVSAFVACHSFRMAMEASQYLDLESPLIAPMAALPDQVVEKLKPDMTFDYGMTVKADHFSAGETGCVIPRRLIAAYALALANSAGAKCIYLAGFDGYGSGNPLQEEMEYVFDCYHAMVGAIPVTAVTPTTYSIAHSSIFSPEI